jgi:transcriptional regulator of acetoin/glycerol metabolism
VEKEVVLATLQRAQGNIKKAAGLLGIDRSTLYDKLKKYKAGAENDAQKRQTKV